MSLLWFLLIAALWAAVLKLPTSYNLGLKTEAVAAALIAIGAAVIVLFWLAAAAVLVFHRKSELARGQFEEPAFYMDNNGASADEYANRYRLLIASKMLSGAEHLPASCFCNFRRSVLSCRPAKSPGSARSRHVLENWTITIIFAILAAGSTFVYSLRAEFAAGLGILADVLAYLNNSYWMSGNTGRSLQERRAAAANLAGTIALRGTNPALHSIANPRGYWLRRRIHDRLDVLIRDPDPRREA